MPELRSFAEFWPYYLRERGKAGTRALHHWGTSLVVLLLLGVALSGSWRLLAAIPIAGYVFAWTARAAIQRNRPAPFTHPLCSLGADFRMWALWLTGRLGAELERAGVTRERRHGR